LAVTLLISFCFAQVYSHGAMTFPPARNAKPGDFAWNSANNGAQTGDWTNERTNVCGQPQYITPGPIGATFTAGQTVNIDISISAYHGGYYEFRLCVPKGGVPTTNQGMLDCLNDPSTQILERVNPLSPGQEAAYKIITPPTWTSKQLATRWRQDPEDGVATGKTFAGRPTYTLAYRIPNNVQCDNCVLHWYWQSLNSWQEGPATSTGTTQGERFWNCADIAIRPSGSGSVSPPTWTPTPASPPTWTPTPSTPTPSNPPHNPPSNPTPVTPPTSTGSCPQWTATGHYAESNVVAYQGSFYKCSQSHTANSAWNPVDAFTLWQKVSSCGTGTMNLEDSTLQPADLNAGNTGDAGNAAVPGWGIGLIVIACAMVVTQVVYIVYRVRRDNEAGYAERI